VHTSNGDTFYPIFTFSLAAHESAPSPCLVMRSDTRRATRKKRREKDLWLLSRFSHFRTLVIFFLGSIIYTYIGTLCLCTFSCIEFFLNSLHIAMMVVVERKKITFFFECDTTFLFLIQLRHQIDNCHLLIFMSCCT